MTATKPKFKSDPEKFGWKAGDLEIIGHGDDESLGTLADSTHTLSGESTQMADELEGTEELYNHYHDPRTGRFTSAGGSSLRKNLSGLKAGKHAVKKNAAEAGHAGRKGDAAGKAKNLHASKIAKGKASNAMERIRYQRAVQIATAKRKAASMSADGAPEDDEFYNHYHDPRTGRFTSAGGSSLRKNLSGFKAGKHAVKKNAAEAGHAGRKGDAAGKAKNLHASKIAKGKRDNALSRVREQRAIQIATAKRRLAAMGK